MRPLSFSKNAYRGREVRLLLERLGDDEFEPLALSSPRLVYEFMRDLRNEPSERMYSVMTDLKCRVSGVYEVGKGGLDTCPVDPREVYKAALVTNSPSFALVHNHPSGIPEPSPDDIALARRVHAGAQLLNLNLLDFMIIGNGRYYSMQECGALPGGSG
jgi:DNA repair protein RadC